MRLHRPYIPIGVRVLVAERQADALGFRIGDEAEEEVSNSRKLAALLRFLFGDRKNELHHRPALVNRIQYFSKGVMHYDPPANQT